MTLWHQKYAPTTLAKFDINQVQAVQLKKLADSEDFPHLMVYGPEGSGKKTRVRCLLREIFGSGVDKLRKNKHTFTAPSGRKVDISVFASAHHFEIKPSNAKIFDRVVINEFIKSIAQTQQLESVASKEFRVIVVHCADQLTRDAQTALRRTMEKYIATCRLILVARSTSRIIPAIRSRCLQIRMGKPSVEECVQIMQNVLKKENLPAVTQDYAEKVVAKSNRSIRKMLLTLQVCSSRDPTFNSAIPIPDLDWEKHLKETARIITQEQSRNTIKTVRKRLFELRDNYLPLEKIYVELVRELMANCDGALKPKIIQFAALYDYRKTRGSPRRALIHYDCFVVRFMAIYKKFMEETMGMM